MDKFGASIVSASSGAAFVLGAAGYGISTLAVVFIGGVMVWSAPATWRATKRGAGWVKAKFAGAADSVRGFIDDDRIDWDAVALGAGATEPPLGQCPECFGQPGASLRAENAILRANAVAGRAELQTLRHQLAMMNDTIAAADRRIAEITASAVESAREVERLRRERSMAKLPTKRIRTPAGASLPGAGQHVEPEKQSRG